MPASCSRCLEGERAVADDPVARPGGVARVAEVEQARCETAALRRDEQAADGCRAARVVGGDLRAAADSGSATRCACRVPSRRRGRGSGSGRCSRRSRLSGPPHSRSSTAATISGSARPTTSGTSANRRRALAAGTAGGPRGCARARVPRRRSRRPGARHAAARALGVDRHVAERRRARRRRTTPPTRAQARSARGRGARRA